LLYFVQFQIWCLTSSPYRDKRWFFVLSVWVAHLGMERQASGHFLPELHF